MLLAIDVGNTHTVFGFYDGADLTASWRVQSDSARTADEWAVLLHGLLVTSGKQFSSVHDCVMSSVVPAITAALSAMSRKVLDDTIMVVGPALDLGIRLDVENPQTVGTDRLVNAAAAYARWGGPCIVVDLGTATTFDVVDASGAFVGGAITPGLKTLAAALTHGTAQLPSVPLVPPPTAIGRNTVAAIQAGVVLGYAALVEGLIARMQAELGPIPAPIPIIATGGLAQTVAAATSIFTHIDPDLTLDGLRLIYERNVLHEVPKPLYSRKRQP